MFKHILVPLDGSPRAETVLPVASQLAHASHGMLTLLHAVSTTSDALSYGFARPYLAHDNYDDELARGKSYLDDVLQRYTYLGDIPVKKQAAVGNAIDLVVMSSHGYTGVKRWMMGSVAEKVTRHASVPVLILRDEEPLYSDMHHEGFCVVQAVVPLDNSARSQDA